MSDKYSSRLRRGRATRARIMASGKPRLCVHRTPRHIYVQLLGPVGDRTLTAASSLDKELRAQLKGTGNVAAAVAVGRLIAQRAKDAGIDSVAFDRSGYKYHGRVKALAEAAREAGLRF